MKDIKDYKEYESLFKDDLVKAVRKLLKKDQELDFQDVPTAGLYDYFNKFGLWKKLTEQEFKDWK